MIRVQPKPEAPIVQCERDQVAEPTLAVALTIAIAIVVALAGVMLRLAQIPS